MEIKDYLRVLGKRAWLLVMIPAVAGVVAGLIAVGQPQAFRTSATLQLPRDETTTPAQVAQLVADFRAAAANPNVQAQVSEETGVPVRRIERVRITQVGDSSQLTMSYQDRRRDAADAKAVINGLAAGALGYLQTPEIRNSEQAVDAANGRIESLQRDAASADDERQAIYREVSSSRPLEELEELRDAKRFYEREELAALDAGNTAAADRYRQRIEEANVRILALERVIGPVQTLEARIAAAEQELVGAQEELAVAQERLAAAGFEPDLTFSAEAQSVVRKTRVVKTAAAAVVAGFPIAIGVVLLLDAIQKRRANRPARPEHDDELAVGEAEQDHELANVAPAPAPALIGATVGAAGLPAAPPPADEELDDELDDDDFVDDDGLYGEDLDEDELDEAEDDAELDDAELDDAELDDADLGEADLADEDAADSEDQLDAEADIALDEDEVDELDDELVTTAEVDVLDDLDGADLDGADLDDADLDDPDLDDPDLGDDLDDLDELDDDVEATVASRRRLYDADIDDDLSVDGGSASRNGRSRVWARVPAADADFDGDDEAGADR